MSAAANPPSPQQGAVLPAGLSPELAAEPFRDGFSRRAVIGAFFLAAVMVPAAIYLSLMLGGGLTSAADWVTVILFLELARRSFQKLSRQEIMILLHVAHSIGTGVGTAGLAGGVFGSLVWHAYLRDSAATAQFGLDTQLPAWVAPFDLTVIASRNLWHSAWLPAIGVLAASYILNKVQHFVCGYLAFRLTADMERLQFPMAPVHAQGAMALAEHSGRNESWRWSAFSIGAALGTAFAVLSTLIPSVTSTFLAQPLFLLPNPWFDMTPFTRGILPAAPIVLTIDLGAFLVGMILPWRVLIGATISSIFFTFIVNPFILYPYGMLPHYQDNQPAQRIVFHNSLDFYMSSGIGSAAAVAIAGIFGLLWALHKRRKKRREELQSGDHALTPTARPSLPEGRGDFNLWLMIGIFAVSSLAYVWLCHVLVPDFPLWIFVAFAFLYTPLMTYVTARMVGITGQAVAFPMVREGTFFLSGYEKPDVWFAPIPLHDYGYAAESFRRLELTRTKFTSMLKAELLVLPIMMIASFLFWSYIWSMDPIPSEKYPPIQVHWPVNAQMSALWATAQSSGATYLQDAIKFPIIVVSGIITLIVLGVFSGLGVSLQYVYGFIGGSHGQVFHVLIPAMLGAIVGRYLLARRFGTKQWSQYAPVIVAGYACGAGLIGMLGMAIVFLQRSVSSLPY